MILILQPRLTRYVFTHLKFFASSLSLYNSPLFETKHTKNLQILKSSYCFTRRKTDYAKRISQQSTVKDLVNLYTKQSISPMSILGAICRSVRKSAKQSMLLIQDSDVRDKYNNILKDISGITLESPQARLQVLFSLAEICTRQKAFLNKTGIDIFPAQQNDCKTVTHENHLTENAKNMFLTYQNVLLNDGLDKFNNKELVKILWSFVETKMGSKELYEVLKNNIMEQEAMSFTTEQIAHIVCSFAKIKFLINVSDVILKMKTEILNQGLVSIRTHEVTDVLYSFVCTEQDNLKIFKQFKKDILSREIRSLSHSQLCQVLWSIAKLNEKHNLELTDLIEQLEGDIIRRGIKSFDNRGLAVIMWSFVNMEKFSKRLFSFLKKNVLKRNVREYDVEDISVILQSFAKVKNKIPSHQIFGKVDKELVHCGFHRFNNHCLATTIWSFAETGNGTHALFENIKKEVRSRNIQEFNSVEFSQIIWGFAKARQKVDVRDLLMEMNYDLSKLSLRQLALVGWSFAVSGVIQVDFFNVLQREISKKDINSANNAVVCQVLYAFAVAEGVVSLGNISELIEERILVSNAKSFENRQLAVLVWSLGKLSKVFKSSLVYEALEKEVCNRALKDYMPSDFCNILWGFTEVHHIIDTTLVFYFLTRELLRRGLWEFSISQITLATVVLTKANKWNNDLIKLFKEEIIYRRNSRHFESLHLCSLAQSLASMNPLETNDLYCWLESEIMDRNASTLPLEELTEIIGILVDRKATKIQFFETVRDQLLMRNSLEKYDKEVLRNVFSLLKKAGVNTSDFELKAVH